MVDKIIKIILSNISLGRTLERAQQFNFFTQIGMQVISSQWLESRPHPSRVASRSN